MYSYFGKLHSITTWIKYLVKDSSSGMQPSQLAHSQRSAATRLMEWSSVVANQEAWLNPLAPSGSLHNRRLRMLRDAFKFSFCKHPMLQWQKAAAHVWWQKVILQCKTLISCTVASHFPLRMRIAGGLYSTAHDYYSGHKRCSWALENFSAHFAKEEFCCHAHEMI